jgi:hypothetical protein
VVRNDNTITLVLYGRLARLMANQERSF